MGSSYLAPIRADQGHACWEEGTLDGWLAGPTLVGWGQLGSGLVVGRDCEWWAGWPCPWLVWGAIGGRAGWEESWSDRGGGCWLRAGQGEGLQEIDQLAPPHIRVGGKGHRRLTASPTSRLQFTGCSEHHTTCHSSHYSIPVAGYIYIIWNTRFIICNSRFI